MEKPYYKSQLRLQKKESTKDKLVYKYIYQGIVMTMFVYKEAPNLNKLDFILSLVENHFTFRDDSIYKKIVLLNLNRILKSEYKGKCCIIKLKIDNSTKYINLNEGHCILLQCGFVLQYTKELGYHFIR